MRTEDGRLPRETIEKGRKLHKEVALAVVDTVRDKCKQADPEGGGAAYAYIATGGAIGTAVYLAKHLCQEQFIRDCTHRELADAGLLAYFFAHLISLPDANYNADSGICEAMRMFEGAKGYTFPKEALIRPLQESIEEEN